MPPSLTVGVIAGGAAALVFLIFLWVFLRHYRKVGPNEALVISGRKHRYELPDGRPGTRGYRIVKGGGTFVWPFVEKAETLSLEVMTIDVKTPEVYTVKGVPIMVDGIAQIKVRGTEQSIATAAEQFLGRPLQEIARVALQTVEGHLRAILGTMEVEQVYRDREAFAQRVQEVAAQDLANMGLQIVSFTLRDIRDGHGYLEALGKPRLSQVKRDAIVAQAEADRDAAIRSAAAKQEGEIAKYEAETKIAAAARDYQMKNAEYAAAVNQKKAEADLAYDLQRFKTGQLVKKEEIQVAIVEREQLIAVQEREIVRRERELEAEVTKPAEAKRNATQVAADAERYKLQAEAEGQAQATRSKGLAAAEVARVNGEAQAAAERAQGLAAAEVLQAKGIAEAAAERARGLAAAEVLQAKGVAEAEAMARKADSWKQYSQAAITQLFLDALPKIASAVSAPLSKTERITIVSGVGDGGGASRITGDVAQIMAQLPPLVETLSGVNLQKLLEGLGGSATPPPPGSKGSPG
jgi:flotillin